MALKLKIHFIDGVYFYSNYIFKLNYILTFILQGLVMFSFIYVGM